MLSTCIEHLKTQPLWIILLSSLGFLSLFKHLTSLLRWLFITIIRPPKNLKNYGSWALITGSTSGIGKAFAVELAGKGLNLILVARNSQKLKAVSNEIQAKHPRTQIKLVVLDFSGDLPAGVREIEEAVKGLDVGVLINNVGVTYQAARFFHEVEEEVWMNVFSRCLYIEYKGRGIDVQCQVPLYVSTKMASKIASVEKSSLFIPSAEDYARAAVRQIGYEARCTPYWAHSLQWFFAALLPEAVLDSWRLSIGIHRRGKDGIGKSLAFELASKGLNLVLVGRNPSKLEVTSNEILERNGGQVKIRTVIIDFAKLSGEEIAKRIEEGIKGLDVGVLVNNVGLANPYARFFHEADLEMTKSILRVNIEGTTWVTLAVLPGMLKKKRGAIVNIGSGSCVAVPSWPLYTIYAATKAYITMFSKSISVEYKQHGIDIQCQIPLLVATKMAAIKRSSFFVPSAETYSKASLRAIGYEQVCVPYWPHHVQWRLLHVLPDAYLNWSHESDSDGTTTTAAYNTVFIDTSLDTHLAMIVSDADTVAHLKNKIVFEHPQCFPKIGEIKIHALKVKLKGYFYHLSDSMLVKSAFEGAKKNWFLSVDASSLDEHNENLYSCKPDTGNQLALLSNTNYPSSDRNNLLPVGPSSRLLIIEGTEVTGVNFECKNENSKNRICDVQCNHSLEEAPQSGHTARKQRKRESKDGTGDPLRENKALVSNSGEDTSKPKTLFPESSMEDKKKGRNATSDCLFTELPEDVHLINNLNSGKSKKKSSAPHEQIVSALLSSLHNVGEESFKEDEEINPKDSRRKKRKRESKGGIGNPLKENKALVSNSGEDTSMPEILFPESFVEDKKKGRNATSDCLFTELPDDVHLINSSISGKSKKKRKKKSSAPYEQIVSAVLSSLHNVGEEGFKEDGKFNLKDSGGVSDAPVVPGENIRHATLPKHMGISQEESHCEPVQEVVEGNKVPCSSIGINTSKPDAGTVKGKEDAPEVAAGFGVKGMKNSKKHRAHDVKGVPPLLVGELDNLNKDVTQSGHENIIPGDGNFGTNQTDKIEEENELSQNHGPEVLHSEKSKHINLSEADRNIKETAISAMLSDANIVMEFGSSAGERRKKKRAEKFVARGQVTSDTKRASLVPHPAFNDRPNSEAKKEESTLSQTGRAKISRPNKVDTSFMVADGEGDDANGNEAESLMLTQINKTQENVENMDKKLRQNSKKNRSTTKEQGNEVESLQLSQSDKIQGNGENVDDKLRKKTKKNKKSTGKCLPDFKEQEVGAEELTSSNDRMTEVDTPSKTTKKTRSVKTSAVNQSTGSELELEKNIHTESGSFHPQQASMTLLSSQVPSSQTLEGNSKGRLSEANIVNNALKNGCMDDPNDRMEDSKSEGDKINFRDYFVPAGHQDKVAPAEVLGDKVNKAKRSDTQPKSSKNTKKPIFSVGTSPDIEFSLKVNENQGSEKKSHDRNSFSIQLQKSLMKDERNEVMLQSNKKSSKVSGNEGQAPCSQDVDKIKSISQEDKQPDVVNGSGINGSAPAYLKENGESSASSSSNSESSDKAVQKRRDNGRRSSLGPRVTVAKASGKNNDEDVTSSQCEKSLLATPGAIFRDGSSKSTEDENEAVNSDASTRTPSDNSSLSGNSERESKLSLESLRNVTSGSHSTKEKEVGGKDIRKSILSSSKNITTNMILKSSSKFKKAKLKASQSQLEANESQPVDFVPDSQANL
ncbi:hypothetical protein F0562_033218 [Nyssa sinensis]|uniref:Very-long-chain 3-oxoacyl-CoA reductase n=1 Tax=Nyssa sinensis TaxID=561372 RepID=A0A5J5ASG1_9ASTE|nr:hypothetical protein F0562_033218 [Nyssa sinensis]